MTAAICIAIGFPIGIAAVIVLAPFLTKRGR